MYDGLKNLYSTKPLKFSSDDKKKEFTKNVNVDIDGKSVCFMIIFNLADSVSMRDAVDYYEGKTTKPISERIISIFEIIFRSVIGKSYTPYQRKFFDLDQVQKSPKVKICDFVQGFINSGNFFKIN